jgi:ketosteroid isomerase-like protein
MTPAENYRIIPRLPGKIALLVMVSIAPAVDAEVESDAAILNETYTAWEKATNARDIDLWSTFLAPNAEFMPAVSPPLNTRQAFLDYYLKSFADPHFSLDCEQLTVDVAESGEMAWSDGICRATFSDRDGQKTMGTSRWFKIWLKQEDGSWKCKLNTWNSVTPSSAGEDFEADQIRFQLTEIAMMTGSASSPDELIRRYMKYFSETPTLLPPDQGAIHGRAAITEFYRQGFHGMKIISNRYTDPVVVVEGGMAVRRYFGTGVVSIDDDPEHISFANRYVDILRKENGEWKMHWHSWVPIQWDR